MKMEIDLLKEYKSQKLTSSTMRNLGFILKRTDDDEQYWRHEELKIEWFYLPTAGQLFGEIIQKTTNHIMSLVEQV